MHFIIPLIILYIILPDTFVYIRRRNGGDRPTSPELPPDLQAAMDQPAQQLKPWAVTLVSRGKGPSLMSSLPPLSSSWLTVLGNTYLLCPPENHPHTCKPANIITRAP